MRIARLEIFGFKSFMERFVLNFDERLIGVVGPNGCGKSNIVDALRWVLGETHAKHLRGAVLDDIIFNGSESRRPLGMAEVSITICPDEGWAKRVLDNLAGQKNGNGHQPDSATELATLEAEDGEDIIAGRIEPAEESVEAQAEERAEEKAVEKELQPVQLTSLFESFPGLFDAAEIQMTRRLYRSGESEYFINRIPCRLRDMTDLYRVIGLGARGLSIVQQGQIGEFISKKPLERRALLEEAAGISGFRVRLEAANRKLDKTLTNLSRLSDIIIEVDKQVTSLRRQSKRAERRQDLKDQQRKIELEHFAGRAARIILEEQEISSRRVALENEVESTSNELLARTADEQKYRAELEECDVELADLRQAKERAFEVLNAQNTRQNELKVRVAELEGKLQVALNSIEFSDERRVALQQESQQRNAELEQARERLNELGDDPADDALPNSADNLATLRETFERLQAELTQLGSEHNAIQLELAAAESAVSALSKRGGEFPTLGNVIGDSNAQRLRDVLGVPEELKQAVNSVLGPKASYLISSDVSEIKRLFDEHGAAEGAALGVLAEMTERSSRHSALKDHERTAMPSAVRLLERLEVPERYAPLLESLIGDVWLVDNKREALAGFPLARARVERNENSFRVVTAEALVVAHWGWASAGAVEQSEDLQLEIKASQDRVTKLSSDEARLANLVREKTEAVQRAEQEYGERRAEHERVERERANAQATKAALAQGRVEFEERRLAEVKQELDAVANQVQAARAEESRLRDALTELSNEQAAAQHGGPDAAEERELIARLHELDSQIESIENKRNASRTKLADLAETTAGLRRRRDELNSEFSQVALSADRSQMELSVLLDDIRQRYGQETNAPETEEARSILEKAEGDLDNYIERLAEEGERLRRKLEREGEVDPESIERYREEKERLEQMLVQRTDLEQATQTLEKTIKQLKDISRERFVHTFEVVNAQFQELVPRLFGGGAGYLELLNPEDPLTSGVDLTVRPPGKKLRSMELLSGGEKALAAVAVLMSMFLYRPSPICVLDEVDAPLDDANLERYLNLIKEISDKTQFLLITHNKVTMTAMEKLVGITMQERGISTALTVSLAEAELELEKAAANQ